MMFVRRQEIEEDMKISLWDRALVVDILIKTLYNRTVYLFIPLK